MEGSQCFENANTMVDALLTLKCCALFDPTGTSHVSFAHPYRRVPMPGGRRQPFVAPLSTCFDISSNCHDVCDNVVI